MKGDKFKKAYIIYIVIAIISGIAGFIYEYNGGQKRYFIYLQGAICVIFCGYLFVDLILFVWRLRWNICRWYISRWFKNWSTIVVVIVITLLIPVGIHFKFYCNEPINQDTFMTAYATYLTFVGAFSLGYFLYKREENRHYEELKKKARLLYDNMQYIQINLKNIDYFIESGETYPINTTWKSDYLDIKHLVKYEETALDYEIKYFFNRMEAINKAIEAGNKERAKRLYMDFEEKEKYSISEYNYMEAEGVLLDIALDMPQRKPWKVKEQKTIDKYAEQFFDVVDMWVYNYLIRNNLTSVDNSIVEYSLVEWMLTNPEIKDWVEHEYDKRKVNTVVHKISLEMNSKSKKLNYYWGCYSLKKKEECS